MNLKPKEKNIQWSSFRGPEHLRATVQAITDSSGANYTDTMLYLLEMGIGAHLMDNVEKSKTKEVVEPYVMGGMEAAARCTGANVDIAEVRKGDQAMDFELFWSAGMVKSNKKKALSLFISLSGKNGGSAAFSQMLRDDVKKRLASGQMGFDALHPTTYLNGERWNDDIKSAHPVGIKTPDYSGFLNDGNNQGVIEHE